MEFGEADRILKLFTHERGKITVIAKGVRKIRSRKAGHLEPFTRVNLFLAKGRNLDIITQAETVDAYLHLKDDLRLVAYASYVVEVLDRFTYEEGQNIGIFNLLVNTLARLESQPNSETVIHYFEQRLLELLGFRPQLFECVVCSETIQPQDQYFSPLIGGVVCPKCAGAQAEAWPVQKDVLKYLRHLQRSKWRSLENVTIPEEVEKGLEALMERYLTYLLERKLNSPGFIRDVKQAQTGEGLD
jgi:DNA repair protein RecO (recombination protein O)